MKRNYHLIRTKDENYKIIHGKLRDAKAEGCVLQSDTDTVKLKILLLQLTKFDLWRTEVADDVSQHQQSSSTTEKSRYELSESDNEDIYATDEDADYRPSSTSSDSSVDDSVSHLAPVKRALFTSNECPLQKSQSVESIQKSGEMSTQETTMPVVLTYAASFQIFPDTMVTMKTLKILHEGVEYKCNLGEMPNCLMGFIADKIPPADHICKKAPSSSSDWTYMFLSRRKLELEVTLRVHYCTPEKAEFRGNEFSIISSTLTTALSLKFEHIEATTTNKKHCCIYCQKMVIEITRHLIGQHSGQSEVNDLLQLKVNSKERNQGFKTLRLRGDQNYNRCVSLNERLPIRKLTTTKIRDCLSCPHCNGVFAPNNIARHERHCSGRPPNKKRIASECRAQELIMRVPSDPIWKQTLMRELLEVIRDDTFAHEILCDFCLRQLSERYAHLHRGNPTALKNDRQHLRRLARLLVEIRDIDPEIIDYEDCILNGNYDTILNGIYRLCDLNYTTGVFGKPALAQVMRSSITLLAKVLANAYLNEGLLKTSFEYTRVERFLSLHDENYAVYVGRSAGRTRLYQKTKKQLSLPDSTDIKLFSTYIVEEAKKAYETLTTNGYTYQAWFKLGQAELARIIVFNRRRVSEVALMSLDLYKNRMAVDELKKKSLTVLEKALADRYTIMTLVAKRARILQVLLDVDQCRHLDLFVKFRKNASVPDSNDYLFGICDQTKYIDPSQAIRFFSLQCGAKKPHLLRATYLRKQVATMSQLLVLNDNQISQVARFMGHTKEVHNNFYRQDEQLFHVTSWAKFLSLVDDEDINKYKGKSLEEIINMIEDEKNVYDESNTLEHTPVNDILDEESALPEANVEEAAAVDFVNMNLDEEISKKISQESDATQQEPQTPKKCKKNIRPVKVQTPQKQTIKEILHTLETSPRRRNAKKRPFHSDEIQIMQARFQHYINSGRLAPIQECQALVNEYFEKKSNIFNNRTGRDLYNWVQYMRNKKRMLRRHT